MRKPEVFLSFSGGLDSTTLLVQLINEDYRPVPVFFHYGSKHNSKEFAAAEAIIHKYQDVFESGFDLNLHEVDLTGIYSSMKDCSALLDTARAIPTGQGGYKEPGSLDATVVPGRNHMFAAVLAAMAEAEALKMQENTCVALAIHAGDHALYPDCRPAFAASLGETIRQSTEGRVDLLTPFVDIFKADIVCKGLEMQVPYGLTWSCYNGGEKPCGVCGTCRERLAAFKEAGVRDPLEYAQ